MQFTGSRTGRLRLCRLDGGSETYITGLAAFAAERNNLIEIEFPTHWPSEILDALFGGNDSRVIAFREECNRPIRIARSGVLMNSATQEPLSDASQLDAAASGELECHRTIYLADALPAVLGSSGCDIENMQYAIYVTVIDNVSDPSSSRNYQAAYDNIVQMSRRVRYIPDARDKLSRAMIQLILESCDYAESGEVIKRRLTSIERNRSIDAISAEEMCSLLESLQAHQAKMSSLVLNGLPAIGSKSVRERVREDFLQALFVLKTVGTMLQSQKYMRMKNPTTGVKMTSEYRGMTCMMSEFFMADDKNVGGDEDHGDDGDDDASDGQEKKKRKKKKGAAIDKALSTKYVRKVLFENQYMWLPRSDNLQESAICRFKTVTRMRSSHANMCIESPGCQNRALYALVENEEPTACDVHAVVNVHHLIRDHERWSYPEDIVTKYPETIPFAVGMPYNRTMNNIKWMVDNPTEDTIDKLHSRKVEIELLISNPNLFPPVQRNRYHIEFLNGVYDILNNRFYDRDVRSEFKFPCAHSQSFIQQTFNPEYLHHPFYSRCPAFIEVPGLDKIIDDQGMNDLPDVDEDDFADPTDDTMAKYIRAQGRSVAFWFFAFIGRLFYDFGTLERWHIFIAIFGHAGVGKSCIMTAVAQIIGGQPSMGILPPLVEGRFALSSILTADIVACLEVGPQWNMPVDILKTMTAGEAQNVPKKHGIADGVQWKAPTALLGNAIPDLWRTNDAGNALARRILPFIMRHVPYAMDQRVETDLLSSLGVFLFKCTQCYRILVDMVGSAMPSKFMPSELVQSKREVLGQINPVISWIDKMDVFNGVHDPVHVDVTKPLFYRIGEMVKTLLWKRIIDLEGKSVTIAGFSGVMVIHAISDETKKLLVQSADELVTSAQFATTASISNVISVLGDTTRSSANSVITDVVFGDSPPLFAAKDMLVKQFKEDRHTDAGGGLGNDRIAELLTNLSTTAYDETERLLQVSVGSKVFIFGIGMLGAVSG